MNVKSLIERFCEKYHHKPSDFEQMPLTDKERLDEQEAVLLEILDIIGGDSE